MKSFTKISLVLLTVIGLSSCANNSTYNSDIIEIMNKPIIENAFSQGANIDIDYMSNIRPIHVSTIDSCSYQLKITKNEEIKALCDKLIKRAQKKLGTIDETIKELKVINTTYKDVDKIEFENHMSSILDKMMLDIVQVKEEDKDKAFLKALIIEFKATIEMSKYVLTESKNTYVQNLALRAIQHKEEEIKIASSILESIQ